jgi:hypothetical protein
MSQYEYEVIRWPFTVDGADADFIIRNTTGGVDSPQSVADGTYINDGSEGVSAPIDMVGALKGAVSAALAALSIGGTLNVYMGTDGRLRFAYSGLTAAVALKDLTSQQIAWLGVGASQITGGLFPIGVAGGVGIITCDYQMSCQWHPMMDAQHDDGGLRRQLVYGDVNLRGQERRVVRSVAGWVELRVTWDFLPSAVMTAARAADSDYATVAGVTAGEDNTWEGMWEYLTDVALDQPYGDNRVYMYLFNDPSSATRTGPFEIILSKSTPGLDGIETGSIVAGMGSEYYPVTIILRTQQ